MDENAEDGSMREWFVMTYYESHLNSNIFFGMEKEDKDVI